MFYNADKLAAAVIEKAVEDYRFILQNPHSERCKNIYMSKPIIEQFFLKDNLFLNILDLGLSGENILVELKKQAGVYELRNKSNKK